MKPDSHIISWQQSALAASFTNHRFLSEFNKVNKANCISPENLTQNVSLFLLLPFISHEPYLPNFASPNKTFCSNQSLYNNVSMNLNWGRPVSEICKFLFRQWEKKFIERKNRFSSQHKYHPICYTQKNCIGSGRRDGVYIMSLRYFSPIELTKV